jgi:hypothetical protein
VHLKEKLPKKLYRWYRQTVSGIKLPTTLPVYWQPDI